MILAFSVLFLGLLFYALPANAYYVYTNHGAVSMDNDYEYDPHYTYVSNPFANLTNTNHDNSNQTIGTTQNNTSVKTTAKTSNNTIINIEAGKQDNPTFDTLKKISRAFGVEPKDLM